MSSLDENAISTNFTWVQSVQTLIIGRLIVVFLLLITTWVWYSGRLELSFDRFPRGVTLIFLVAVGLTPVYFFLLRLSRNLTWQIWLQFLVDAVLITALIWQTGDLTSPYITLYIVLISVSSIFLKPVSTIILAFVCVGLFAGMAFLSTTAWISEPLSTPPAKIVQIVSFNVVAFLIVGLLAARLAERRFSGEELEETTKSLANLRLLHERIIESIRSGLITTDLDGKIFTFNAAATEITGFTAGEMIGRSIHSLFGNIQEAIDHSLREKEEHEQPPRFEANLVTPDGFAVRIGYNVSQLVSETNETSGLIVTFQDLTEIRSMEENVRRKDRLAAVGRVGAGLAHEIRNPLGAMRGAIQVLEASVPKESVHADLMHIIMRESDRLNSIITNFLSYARPKTGNHVETDVCEAIRETVKLLQHSPEVSDRHEIVAELPEDIVTVMGDATQLKQIFWNLARNSIKAMPDGGKFAIAIERVAKHRIRIVFSDTGSGMSAEQVERLFEPFSNSTTGGTGLGLSIVYQIVRDHNGTINVRSAEGEGTVITVEFPTGPVQRQKVDRNGDVDGAEPSPLNGFLKVAPSDTEVSP
ncbi:MAG TPA: ATP-binding protein [Pyrinomonadaceae bacterium]|nr:ATP-binding protein [Pyrinomonadaceae bacterium]